MIGQPVYTPMKRRKDGTMILHCMDVYIMNPRTERLNKLGTYRVHVYWSWDDPKEKRTVGYIRRKGEMREVTRMYGGDWFLLPKRDGNGIIPEPSPELATRI
jgi:hypothetical protein